MTHALAIVKRARRVSAAAGRAFRTCALQCLAALAIAACATAAGAVSGEPPQLPQPASPPQAPPPLAPPLEVAPLESVRIAGGFGETRSNHIHPALDFSTGGVTGRPVRAPMAGFVERVRGSGIGYGRSVYLRTRDGRLLVFGHLDAYAPVLAAYVDSVQQASGQYEQDLWPAPGRFRFGAGETLAWSGESGGGGPHLHFEIRHGDFALNPVRAGLAYAAYAPRIEALTLEPLDSLSRIEGSAGPRTWKAPAWPETLVARGRLRAIVRARAGWPGVNDTPAWSIAARWRGGFAEMRMDSLSWATDMTEQDEMLDRGRVANDEGAILWAPALWRPRLFVTNAPLAQEAGTIDVPADSPATPLELVARDEHGVTTSRTIWLRAPRAGERPGVAPPGKGEARAAAWTFASLPGGFLRVRVTGAPGGLAAVRLAKGDDAAHGAEATWDGGGWCAVLPAAPLPAGDGFAAWGSPAAGGAAWTARVACTRWPLGADVYVQPAEFASLSIPPDAVYERGTLVTEVRAPAAGAELAPLSPVLAVSPWRWALRRPLPVRFTIPPGGAGANVAIYRRAPGGSWDWIGGAPDSTKRAIATTSSFLGEFALMRDAVAPRVRVPAPPRAPLPGPYSRWALECAVSESGSGVDARASSLAVDGRRVAIEWDSDANVLRWRPRIAPSTGAHAYAFRVVDRAGNASVSEGRFVLDSGPRKSTHVRARRR